MAANHEEFVSRNEKYVEGFTQGGLALPPAKKYIVVTCMDARVEPASQLGISLGDAHVIRNAGGLAKDALRSIVISQRLLGTREIALFHHTGCGMLLFDTPQLKDIVKGDAGKDKPGREKDVEEAVEKVGSFGEFHERDLGGKTGEDERLEESVRRDVEWLKEHPLVLEGTVITGWVYDVTTGKVKQIV